MKTYNLNKYKKDNLTHFINRDYPNLKAIHMDPWIFVVDDFLTNYECQQLIRKAKSSNKMAQAFSADSKTGNTVSKRGSLQLRFHYAEVNKIQEKISKLINLDINNFEALKISYYPPGAGFGFHDDVTGNYRYPEGVARIREECPQPYSCRLVTCLIYLNDVDEGGETYFPDFHCQGEDDFKAGRGVQLSVKPKKGMALLFMPGYLPTAERYPKNNPDRSQSGILPGGKVYSLGHRSNITNNDKWICQQWAWGSPYYTKTRSKANNNSNYMLDKPIDNITL